WHPLRLREGHRSRSDEQDMTAVLEDPASQTDRVRDPRDRADGARPEPLALHEGGVALDSAFLGEGRAPAGVEERVGLHDLDRRLEGAQGGAAALEPRPAGNERGLDDDAIGWAIVGIGAGTAVDDQGGDHCAKVTSRDRPYNLDNLAPRGRSPCVPRYDGD